MDNFETPKPRPDNTLWIIAGIAAGTLVCVCVAVVLLGGAAGLISYVTLAATPFVATAAPYPVPMTAAATAPSIVPTLGSEPPPPESEETLAALEAAELPARDRYDLAARFLGIDEASVTPPGEYEVGDREMFYVDNVDDSSGQASQIEAELAYKTEHVYMWVEVGQDYDQDALERSADRFENETYPTNRSYFGSEPNPGIDGDPHLFVLHNTMMGGSVAGYFYSPSEFPREIVPNSNEKEIFYINITNTQPGSFGYDATLAHEFQHMIHWSVDRNEETWMNEGLSEVAATLNGFGASGFLPYFLQNPDLQLTGWPENGDTASHYGAGYLFNMYFLDQFGQDALRALVAHPENGLQGVDLALADLDEDFTADDIFANWIIANYVNDRSFAPAYGYDHADLASIGPPGIAGVVTSYPTYQDSAVVQQYGTDYISLEAAGEVRIHFEGARQVRILPTSTENTDGEISTDDSFVWWSNRGDESDTTLTRAIDLTDADEAVLEYDVWFWMEALWDYGYVEVSTDGGDTWTILETPYTTTENPYGNSYGPGYSGQSIAQPGANAEGWLHESLDLSAYAGQEILLRFETLTDDAVNQPGMAVDNLCIDALGWCDDAEDADPAWEAEGFVRHNNVLSQQFAVQVIAPNGNGGVEVLPLELDEENQGEIEITVDAGSPAVLVIAGMTRYTTEPAVYRYEITLAE